MAETRKFQPSSSAVGDAVRAALGEPVRPVQPGVRPAPASGAAPAASDTPDAPVAVRTFTFGVQRQPVGESDAE
ncbi:MAG: hypothetical protein QM582_10530 [Micropruina sp.]|uniref:hypothetical protein n=1 Tax=Micropruina sp. TaxID=2737536 RepID=UPI0039E63A6F